MSENQPQYNRAYFIRKFKAIPEEQWLIHDFAQRMADGTEQCCALGHCGNRYNKLTHEAEMLDYMVACRQKKLNQELDGIHTVNDGLPPYHKLGDHPKTRVLAFLRKPLKELAQILK